MPIAQSLVATRNRDFAPTLSTYYFGEQLPLAGASVGMEVRLYPGAAGAAVTSDPTVDFDDTFVGQQVDPTDGVLRDKRCLTLSPSIARATLAAIPGLNSPEAGDSQSFFYEIMLTYADGLRDSLWIGAFILEPGVFA